MTERKDMHEEKPDLPACYRDLVQSYMKSDQFEEALKYQKELYALLCQTRGETDPKTEKALDTQVSILLFMYEFDKAQALLKKAYMLRCKAHGAKDDEVEKALDDLIAMYENFGWGNDSPAPGEKLCDLLAEKLGEGDLIALDSLYILASVYNVCSEPGKALELQEKLGAISRRAAQQDRASDEEPEEEDVADFEDTLVELQEELGNFEIADCVRRGKIYADFCAIRGEEHPDTLEALIDLACAYEVNCDFAVALQAYRDAYALSCKLYGKAHEKTLWLKKKAF